MTSRGRPSVGTVLARMRRDLHHGPLVGVLATAMLLGAARHLAENPDFAGTVYLIFQPAEENEGGARVMIEEGLFDRFSMDAVYGMHNAPGLGVGQLELRDGPMLAGFDIFDIEIQGKGAHAAEPHTGIDPIVVQANLVNALQTICSRNIDPLESADHEPG